MRLAYFQDSRFLDFLTVRKNDAEAEKGDGLFLVTGNDEEVNLSEPQNTTL